MSSYPARRGRPRKSVQATRAATATRMSDELLLADIDVERANVTGQPVNGHRPQFYGVPLASRAAAERLTVLEAEARKRGLIR